MDKYKNLYIVRHGKSTWDYEGILDVDRPLKTRGINDAYTMAKRFVFTNDIPGLILSSYAARALQTASIFARVLEINLNHLKINKDIYHADLNTLLNIIKKTDEGINSLMIFGHNPVFTDLVNKFMEKKIENLPTTGMVGLKFKAGKWSEIESLKPENSFFDYPKNIT